MSKNAANKRRAKRAYRDEMSRFPISKVRFVNLLANITPPSTPFLELIARGR